MQVSSTRFNPRPTRRSGATRPRPGYVFVVSCFNPRPTRRSGATPTCGICRPARPTLFQSSPNPKVGRYSCSRSDASMILSFQSSPNPKVGRYSCALSRSVATGSFNPRPTRRSGATHVPGDLVIRQPVSILAQPEGRALLADEGVKHQTAGRFNPRPTRRSGATPALARFYFGPPGSFQSSPNPKVGRYFYRWRFRGEL